MARTVQIIESISVTDDITGKVYNGVTDDLGEWMDVNSYRVTIDRIDANGEVISTAFTKDVDMHNDTFNALESFFMNNDHSNLFFVIASAVSTLPVATITAIWSFLRGGPVAELLSLLGARPKPQANSGNGNSGKGNAYTAHVRAYASAMGWKGANGKPVGEKGKMSQDVVVKFQTATGITLEKFNAGERAVMPEFLSKSDMPANPTESMTTN
jgi:hypothetical protein